MNKDREKAILEIAIKEKQVTVKELARRLFASEPSIRRDLNSLEKQRLLKRTHGGAELDENAISEIRIPFLIRELAEVDEKIKIARMAAELVKDGDIIFLDSSTSAYNIIPFLAEKGELLVITNGIKALSRLGEYNIACIGSGGKVINSCLAFSGEAAAEAILRYNADICFFSCRGISDDGRLTDLSEPENEIRKKMIGNSAASYMLCTSDKKNKLYYHNLCSVEEITGMITVDGIKTNLSFR